MLIVGKPVEESAEDEKRVQQMQQERQRIGTSGRGQARKSASQPSRQLPAREYRRDSVVLGNQKTPTLYQKQPPPPIQQAEPRTSDCPKLSMTSSRQMVEVQL